MKLLSIVCVHYGKRALGLQREVRLMHQDDKKHTIGTLQITGLTQPFISNKGGLKIIEVEIKEIRGYSRNRFC